MKCVESRNRWAESHPSVGKCDAGPVITWNVSTLMYVYKYIRMIEVIDISVDGRKGRKGAERADGEGPSCADQVPTVGRQFSSMIHS